MTTKLWTLFIELVYYGSVADDWASAETAAETENIEAYCKMRRK